MRTNALYEKNGQPKPNIDNVISAAETVAPFLKPNDIVIIESTCPIGTTQLIETNLRESGAPINEIHIAYCPERVLPGKIMSELVENDRIVGGNTETATVIAAEFYRTFVSGRVFETNAKTAELCKLAENSFRDVNIAFANELSMICENEKIDVWSLIQLANRHPRVNILQPGPGVGGHCIAVDPWFIVAHDAKNSNLIRCAREINDSKTKWVIDRIKDAASVYSKGTGTPLKIACFGLAFKPNIDDLRGSPALEVALALKARGYDVIGVEPNIIEHNKIDLFPIEQALDEADILILLVGHKEFLVPKIKQKLAKKTTLDFCGVLK